MKIIQEHTLLTKECPFLISIFNKPDLNYPLHQHKNAYELTLTSGLSGTRMVGDSTEPFFDRDIVLMSPGLPHAWQDHGIQPMGDHQVIVIHFLETLFSEERKRIYHLNRINTALKESKYGLELVGESKEEALEILQKMDKSHSFENYVRVLNLLNLFGDSNQTKRLSSEGYTQPVFKNEGKRIEQVLQYIQKNYSRKLLLEEVARQIHLSPSAFSHYFKSRTLKSYTEYILELRLGKAAQLLEFTEMPVTQVGFESGFQNNSHFNVSFKKKYRLTPLAFRKKRQQFWV